MKNIVVLFNLQNDADVNAYEAWAKSTDLPIVNNLDSIDRFDVYKTTGLLGSDATAPYQYVEWLTINDMDKFGSEIGSDTMQKVAAEFQTFADSPLFITLEEI